MATNVEVKRSGTENPLGLLRRFTKRVQGSGVLSRVRSIRYYERHQSHYKNKMRTLQIIEHRKEIARDIKLGKINPDLPRGKAKR